MDNNSNNRNSNAISQPIIHPEGWKFVVIFLVITICCGLLWQPLAWVGLILSGWCLYFFRDPKRVTPTREGLIISPADGIVQAITTASPPAELGMEDAPLTRISIFLNVFDVHVNRVPIGGTITKSVYHPGKFFNASLDKASIHNERQSLVVETPTSIQIAFVQIAGLIARRIRCDVKEGDVVKTGSHFGLIRFGSRMDVYMPQEIQPLVMVGQRMIAGETVLADISSNESARTGEIR